MNVERKCGTCAHWKRGQAADAAGRVRADRVAQCGWAGTITVPEAAGLRSRAVLLSLRYMTRDCGTSCDCWRDRSAPPPAGGPVVEVARERAADLVDALRAIADQTVRTDGRFAQFAADRFRAIAAAALQAIGDAPADER